MTKARLSFYVELFLFPKWQQEPDAAAVHHGRDLDRSRLPERVDHGGHHEVQELQEAIGELIYTPLASEAGFSDDQTKLK